MMPNSDICDIPFIDTQFRHISVLFYSLRPNSDICDIPFIDAHFKHMCYPIH